MDKNNEVFATGVFKDKSKFAIGSSIPPKTISIGINNSSAILVAGGYLYDLRAIDLNNFEAIEIDGIRFVKEKDNG